MDEMCNVHLLNMPSWRFSGPHALRENRNHARKYERAIRNYADTGDTYKLIRALVRLDYDADDIMWHLDHPGETMPHSFASIYDTAARNYYGPLYDALNETLP